MLIGCPLTAERQKIGFDPIATERQLRRHGRWKRQRRNGFFSRKQCNSYGAYVILTEFTQRQRRNGNGMVETMAQLVAEENGECVAKLWMDAVCMDYPAAEATALQPSERHLVKSN